MPSCPLQRQLPRHHLKTISIAGIGYDDKSFNTIPTLSISPVQELIESGRHILQGSFVRVLTFIQVLFLDNHREESSSYI